MSAQTFIQKFDGYWREQNKIGIPAVSGIYCVYEGHYNAYNNTVDLLKLIYIGESESVRDRIAGHEKIIDWKKYIHYGNEIVFSCTPIQSTYRFRVEAALIYEHKPPVNTEYVNEFPFDTTSVYTSGQNALLRDAFTVYSTKNSLFSYLYR